MRRLLALLLLAALAGLGCRSTQAEKVDNYEPSPWLPPDIISADKWWQRNELGGLDR